MILILTDLFRWSSLPLYLFAEIINHPQVYIQSVSFPEFRPLENNTYYLPESQFPIVRFLGGRSPIRIQTLIPETSVA
jgi:hypothetical protein